MHRPLALATCALALAGLTATGLFPCAAAAQDALTGKVGTELRYFPQDTLYPQQSNALGTSIHVEPELYAQWDDGDTAVLAAPFLRVDQHDRRRSHADLRELYLRRVLSRDFELRVGIARVFWGVTESKHLVDVINQRDLVESPDAESALGQPLVQLSWIASGGVIVDLFAMSGFRERTFPGAGGRLRGPLVIDDDASYQSALKRGQPEGALRVAISEGALELGLHYFFGTRRDPEIRIEPPTDPTDPTAPVAEPILRPHYGLMHRTGVDAALVLGDTLLKLEAIARTDGRGRAPEGAVTGGFEHTLTGLVGQTDLGLLLEYSHDGRDPLSALLLEDDVFGGLRLAFNDVDDTQLLMGAAVHHDLSSTLLLLEASRRLNGALSLELEARFFVDPEPERFEYALRRDGHVQALLLAYF